MVAALGRLDDGEGDIVGGDALPVDLALMMGNVDAPDRIALAIRGEGLEIEKAACSDEAGKDQTGRTPKDDPVLQALPRHVSLLPLFET
jgi:hypothetical protein